MDCLTLVIWREYDQIFAVYPIELIAGGAACGIKTFLRDCNGARTAILEIDERNALYAIAIIVTVQVAELSIAACGDIRVVAADLKAIRLLKFRRWCAAAG